VTAMALKLCQVAPQSGSLQAGKVGGGGGGGGAGAGLGGSEIAGK